jgi:pilus assembly protein CpaF
MTPSDRARQPGETGQLARLLSEQPAGDRAGGSDTAQFGSAEAVSEELDRMRQWFAERLATGIEQEAAKGLSATELQALLAERFQQVYAHARLQMTREGQARLFGLIVDEVLGYGPISPLLRDPEVSEIMVNGPRSIWAERKGKIAEAPIHFDDDAHVIRIAQRIVRPLGRTLDRQRPYVDARLPDGSRVHIIIPPCAIDGPTMTIRKFPLRRLTIDDLIQFGTLTANTAELLKDCVLARLNIVVAGGTGSGKTTLLNVLSSFIPDHERIVTIEDSAELQLAQRHVVRLETAAADTGGAGQVSIRELLVNSLRMRPDRLVIGEVRGGEALDLLQAMNTGHDGCLATVHANTARDVISRLETLALMAGLNIPIEVVRQQIAAAVDLLVVQSRLRDGSRRIVQITEIQGMEGNMVTMQDLFLYRAPALTGGSPQSGSLQPTGMRPKFMPRLEELGLKLGAEIFTPTATGGTTGRLGTF